MLWISTDDYDEIYCKKNNSNTFPKQQQTWKCVILNRKHRKRIITHMVVVVVVVVIGDSKSTAIFSHMKKRIQN